MEMILPTEPETNKQLLKRSLRLYSASFTHVFIFAFFLGIIVFIPRFLADIIGQDIFLNVPLLSPYRLWMFFIGLIGLMFFIAIIWRMHCVNRGFHEPLFEDFSVGIKKAVQVFIATVIQSAILFAVAILIFGIEILLAKFNLLFSDHLLGITFSFLIFLGQLFLILYVSTLFIFLVPIIAIEKKGILGALERSVFLVWNHWWRVFTLQLTPWLCYLLVLILLKYLLHIDIHIYFTEQTSHPLWTTLLQFLLFIFFIPWVAAILLVQLKDLELRKHIALTGENAL